MQWKNQIGQDVAGGKAGPAELTKGGMKEQYCLGQRMRERFPESLRKKYSPFSFSFRSTQSPRAMNRWGEAFSLFSFDPSSSLLQFIVLRTGLVSRNQPRGVCVLVVVGLIDIYTQAISLTTMEDKHDVYLRYDDLPCKKYDQKVTYNKVCTKHNYKPYR